MTMKIKNAEEEAFEQGFYGIPDPKIRAKMSPERLAIELSNQEKGSSAYLLLEHELHLRIASIQANATQAAGRYGVLAAVLGAVVTFFLGYYLGAPK
ncbi:MAG: hypothetical protein WA917_02870 [Comamonas sp.]